MNTAVLTREQREAKLEGMGCKRKRVEDIRFTQGKGNYTMEFSRYAPVPKQEQEEMIKKYKEKLAKEAAARK